MNRKFFPAIAAAFLMYGSSWAGFQFDNKHQQQNNMLQRQIFFFIAVQAQNHLPDTNTEIKPAYFKPKKQNLFFEKCPQKRIKRHNIHQPGKKN